MALFEVSTLLLMPRPHYDFFPASLIQNDHAPKTSTVSTVSGVKVGFAEMC